MVKRVKRKTGAGKKGSQWSKKQRETLRLIESKAKRALRLSIRARLLSLTWLVEPSVRELCRASELDEAQLLAVSHRFIPMVDNIRRVVSPNLEVEDPIDDGVGGGDGGNGNGGNGGNGNVGGGGQPPNMDCMDQAELDYKQCMSGYWNSGPWSLQRQVCAIAYYAAIAGCLSGAPD
jgi:hypothetical protein